MIVAPDVSTRRGRVHLDTPPPITADETPPVDELPIAEPQLDHPADQEEEHEGLPL